MLIPRPLARRRIELSFRAHPAVALLGPRQCGKSTLARAIAEAAAEATIFDLERAADQRRLATPEQSLAPLRGLVVIDEIQRQPALLETLRVLHGAHVAAVVREPEKEAGEGAEDIRSR